ncbi:Aldo/keto reductase [Sanghuangporus baumii]|uniref:Aldo/keto reductase n=1 Tax=Sanghuangporus baumii TaxID=108892 RepID=A0A9Q5I365_SANBA|nr:Aldo/keto reductase [Sanghuangporus baumii]
MRSAYKNKTKNNLREDLVGEALQELYDKHGKKREDLWLQTKFTSITGQDRSKPLPYDPSLSVSEQVCASFQTSLRNLHTTYLDSYILHSPLSTQADTLAAWNVLNSLKEQGKVRMIGVSNAYQVSIIELLDAEHKVEVVQNRWYQENDWDKDVVKYCSPSLLKHRTVLEFAQNLQCTPAQVIFCLAQFNGVTPLAGSKNPTHMKDGVTAENISLDRLLSDPKMEGLQKLLFE